MANPPPDLLTHFEHLTYAAIGLLCLDQQATNDEQLRANAARTDLESVGRSIAGAEALHNLPALTKTLEAHGVQLSWLFESLALDFTALLNGVDTAQGDNMS